MSVSTPERGRGRRRSTFEKRLLAWERMGDTGYVGFGVCPKCRTFTHLRSRTKTYKSRRCRACWMENGR